MQIAAPAVAAIVVMQAIKHGLIGGALHRDIQRRVNAQALLVHGGGAVGAFEILANFFDEIRREIVVRRRQMQRQRSGAAASASAEVILPLVRHQREHQIAAGARALRMQESANTTGPRMIPASNAASGSVSLPTGLPK